MNMSGITKLAGGYIITEGILSIVGSEDKRVISQIGRAGRIALGLYFIVKKE